MITMIIIVLTGIIIVIIIIVIIIIIIIILPPQTCPSWSCCYLSRWALARCSSPQWGQPDVIMIFSPSSSSTWFSWWSNWRWSTLYWYHSCLNPCQFCSNASFAVFCLEHAHEVDMVPGDKIKYVTWLYWKHLSQKQSNECDLNFYKLEICCLDKNVFWCKTNIS